MIIIYFPSFVSKGNEIIIRRKINGTYAMQLFEKCANPLNFPLVHMDS